MDTPTISGLALAAALILFGAAAAAWQVRAARRLKAVAILPSDDRAYFRKRHRRRFLTGVLIAAVGGMICVAYASGMETRVDNLKPDPNVAGRPKLEGDDKQFVQFWGGFWIVVVALVFTVVGLAVADSLATRRYAMRQYRLIRDDHEARLRRDLAVHVAQKQAGTRAGRLGHRANPGSDAGDE